MAKWILISPRFEGTITYGYNEFGLLDFFEVNAVLTQEQSAAVLKNLRHALENDSFHEWAKNNHFKVAQLEEDLSFERFWNEYGAKRNRIDAEKLWNKMTTSERQQVFHNLKAYKRYMIRNQWYTQMYPDTYLRKHWGDEWDKA